MVNILTVRWNIWMFDDIWFQIDRAWHVGTQGVQMFLRRKKGASLRHPETRGARAGLK